MIFSPSKWDQLCITAAAAAPPPHSSRPAIVLPGGAGSTLAGIVLGARIPESWSLDFALPLTFLAILVPQLKDRPSVASALVAGGLSVALIGMPLKLGLMAAILGGVAAGALLEALARQRSAEQEPLR